MVTQPPRSVKMQSFFARRMTPPGPHALVYRATRGLLGSRLPSVKPHVLLLTVRGRRTGRERRTPLVYFPFDEGVAVAATNNGKDAHPAWFLNVESDPEVTIQLGREMRTVRAHVTSGSERARYWHEMCEIHPLFRWYERQTNREIPVLVMEDETP